MDCSTKLEAITEDTLVVGIDVSKDVHVARVFDYRGVELCSRIQFENTREGFNSLIGEIETHKSLHMKKDTIIGLEPTGVYGHALIAYLRKNGHNVVYILGMQVKRAKELEDNSHSKNDFKDPWHRQAWPVFVSLIMIRSYEGFRYEINLYRSD